MFVANCLWKPATILGGSSTIAMFYIAHGIFAVIKLGDIDDYVGLPQGDRTI